MFVLLWWYFKVVMAFSFSNWSAQFIWLTADLCCSSCIISSHCGLMFDVNRDLVLLGRMRMLHAIRSMTYLFVCIWYCLDCWFRWVSRQNLKLQNLRLRSGILHSKMSPSYPLGHLLVSFVLIWVLIFGFGCMIGAWEGLFTLIPVYILIDWLLPCRSQVDNQLSSDA